MSTADGHRLGAARAGQGRFRSAHPGDVRDLGCMRGLPGTCSAWPATAACSAPLQSLVLCSPASSRCLAPCCSLWSQICSISAGKACGTRWRSSLRRCGASCWRSTRESPALAWRGRRALQAATLAQRMLARCSRSSRCRQPRSDARGDDAAGAEPLNERRLVEGTSCSTKHVTHQSGHELGESRPLEKGLRML